MISSSTVAICLLEAQEAFLVSGLDHLAHDGGGGGQAGLDATLTGGKSKADGDMGLADAERAKGVMSKTCFQHE
ncbi:MAG: hypothetical protein ACJAVR_003724 [Paracoccaceae bacterium]|jgi:hypothetical protein